MKSLKDYIADFTISDVEVDVNTPMPDYREI